MSDTSSNIYDPYRGSNSAAQVRDISVALGDSSKWGALNEFHWWSKPAAGYYCLANNDTVLQQHAEMLRDAGIDFIYFDSTNEENHSSGSMVAASFDRLLTVWRNVTNAPKVVPWVPITANGTMVTHMLDKLNETANQGLRFFHDGKPLVISVGAQWNDNGTTRTFGPGPFLPDATRVGNLSANYTIRHMWSYTNYYHSSMPSSVWSYLEQCTTSGFKASGGTNACTQRYSARSGGGVEQVPVTPAYQFYQLMSDSTNAVPKFRGKTWWQQFKRAYDLGPELVMLTGWNEWIAQRGCRDNNSPYYGYSAGSNPTTCPSGTYDTMPDGKKVFADQYDVEYNRDMEPADSAASMGDFYYQLMRTCVLAYKSNTLCTIPSTPAGVVESITSSAVDGKIVGWAYDPNSPASSINVHVYFYPPSGSPTVVGATANVYRADVNSTMGITGNHGFSVDVPSSLYNGTTYTVRVYGIDGQDPSGNSNAELTSSGGTFNYSNSMPTGVQDGVQSDGTVVGWAYDPNHPSSSAVSIHVTYWNPSNWSHVTTVVTSTSNYRPDVNSYFGITGNHGYSARYCNGQQLYASTYAFDLNNTSAATHLGGHYVPACTPAP